MLSRLLHKIHKKAWSIVPLGASVAAPAALALKSQQEEPEKELLSVFWIIRHGWRTPISIRTFGYMKDLDWECYTADETLEFRNNHLILHRGGQILDTFQPVFRSELGKSRTTLYTHYAHIRLRTQFRTGMSSWTIDTIRSKGVSQ